MAHRKHVSGHIAHLVVLAATIALLAGGCSRAGAPPHDDRGRVIDQDTGLPIAGAIVVGKYMGSIASSGASSCNRVESAVSDQDGWFTLPFDARDSPPFMEAYHRGYKWGRGPRWAVRGADGNLDHWQVQVVEWNTENRNAKLLRYEPAIYGSQAEALEASREWKDVYLKPFAGTREQRLYELHRLTTSCGGGPRATAGLDPYLQAIYEEQTELGDSADGLRSTRDFMKSATHESQPK